MVHLISTLCLFLRRMVVMPDPKPGIFPPTHTHTHTHLDLCPEVGGGKGTQALPHHWVPDLVPVRSNISRFLPVEKLPSWATSYLHAPSVWGMAPIVQTVISITTSPKEQTLQDPLVLKVGGGGTKYCLGPYRSVVPSQTPPSI